MTSVAETDINSEPPPSGGGFSFSQFLRIKDMINESAIIMLTGKMRGPTLDKAMILLTNLGSGKIIFGAAVIFVLLLVFFKKWYYLIATVMVISGQELIGRSLKHVFARPRPEIINPLVESSGYSFPSGHALAAACFWGLIAYFLFKEFRGKTFRLIMIMICASIVAVVGFSRVYLGIHWPSDVLGGYAIGFILLAACIKLPKKYIRL